MNIPIRHLLTAAVAAALLASPVLAQSQRGTTQSAERGTPPTPPPAVDRNSDRAADAIDRARNGLPRADAQPPTTDQDEAPMTTPPPPPEQSQGTTHAQPHSSVAQRGLWAQLDTDVDGRISSSEGSANADFNANFGKMDGNGDGFVSDSEYRAYAKTMEQETPRSDDRDR